MLDERLQAVKGLTDEEKGLLNVLLDSPLPFVDTLYRQICLSEIKREKCASGYYMDFLARDHAPAIDLQERVPITVDLCSEIKLPSCSSKEAEYFNRTGTFHRLDDSCDYRLEDTDSYYSLLPHFSKGILFELELIHWNLEPIDHAKLTAELASYKRIFRYRNLGLYEEVLRRENLKGRFSRRKY